MELAPIGVSTYSRVDHLRQTVAALQRNTLATESELYIFSDAPKPGDEDKVRAVRSFIKTIDGFKRVEIVERATNSRTYNNRQGMRMLLEKYGRMIFMEEDIVTAPSFLEFMNSALEKYRDNPRIFSITGYGPPINIPKDYPYDVFFLPRFNPWGFGIWKDRFDKIEMQIPSHLLKKIFLTPRLLYQFSRVGLDVIPLALRNYFEFVDALDGRVFPQQFAMGLLTLYPVRHLVDNIGLDGSGVHKKKKYWFKVRLSTEAFAEPVFPVFVEPHPRIMKSFYVFRSGSYLNRVKILMLSAGILLRALLVSFNKKVF